MDKTLTLVTLMLGLLDQAAKIGNLIAKARAEGRDVTTDELDALALEDATARQQLVDAIAAGRAAGRAAE